MRLIDDDNARARPRKVDGIDRQIIRRQTSEPPMKQPFALVTPDRLRITQGGGCLSLFGLPFFAAGVFLILAAAGAVPIRGDDPLVWPVLALLGTVFTAVGGTLVFGRSWTTLDRAQRQVVKQWGLLVPMREQIVPLDGYAAVTLGFVEGDSDSADRFPVALKSHAGPDLPLCSFTAYPEARACAKAVGDHLHLDLEDATTDHPVRRPAGQPELTLQERLRSEGVALADVARPPGARSQVTREHGVVTIVIPVRPHSKLMLATIAVPVVIGLTVGPSLEEFFRRTQTPDPVAWFFLAFLALFVGLPAVSVLYAFLRSRRGATIVDASRQALRIRERGIWRTRTVASVDASDILDVDYSSGESSMASARRTAEQQVLRSHPAAATTLSPRVERMLAALARSARGRGLTVKTRTRLLAFGQGLDDEEVRYLHAAIVRALVE
jgi:hypothetical protein